MSEITKQDLTPVIEGVVSFIEDIFNTKCIVLKEGNVTEVIFESIDMKFIEGGCTLKVELDMYVGEGQGKTLEWEFTPVTDEKENSQTYSVFVDKILVALVREQVKNRGSY